MMTWITFVDHPFGCNKRNYANILIMDHEHVIIRNAIAFLQMYKCLIIPLHPPNIYMLELSPASMQCTHGTAVKLFCRCCCLGGCEVMLYSPLHNRPWIEWIQDDVAEPPELYGPHVPTIVFQTFDNYTCKPDNSGSLSGVLGKTQIIHVLQLMQDQQRSCYNIITFDIRYLTSECRII
jgi:hypothetical protein